MGFGRLPFATRRGQRPAFQVVERGVVNGHQARPGASFDGQVAQCHAAFHRQRAHGLPLILDGVASGPCGADASDQRQGQVFGVHPGRQFSFDLHGHVPSLRLRQALGGHHVFHLGSAHPLGEGAERAVGGSVGVAADDGHARLGGALLGPHDMNDALAYVEHAELPHPVPAAVVIQGDHLLPGHRVGDSVDPCGPVVGRHVVVGRG